MLRIGFLLSLLLLVSGDACDPQKQNERINSLEIEVKQLNAEIVELKQKQASEHHYELRNEGFRTFRFDPATGDTCIKLTSDADWKRKETKAQSCECTDLTQQYLEMPMSTEQQQKNAGNFFDSIVKPACGT
jgi:hypothetical protein